MTIKKTKVTRTTIVQTESSETGWDDSSSLPQRSSIELDDQAIQEGADINLGGTKTLGGPTGGDLEGGGAGPAIGAKHPADNATADHYGSREETNAALEEKIAIQNTRRLYGHY